MEEYREQLEKIRQLKPLLETSLEKVRNIQMEHNKKMAELLFAGKSNKVQTDVNGIYKFQGVKRGKYLLFASQQVFDNKITWLTVVDISDRENKLDLSSNNTHEVFYDIPETK